MKRNSNKTKAQLIDELEEMRQRLANLQAAIDERIEFTRVLVHELKTPLTPIIAASELLMEEVPEGPLFRLARSINKGSQTLARRIDSMLDVAKGEVGMLELNRKKADLLELLRRVADDMTPLASARNLTFNLQLPERTPPVWIDEERLRQVVVNLLDNSFKFTPEGGQVILGVKEKDDTLVVEVKDTGPGLSVTQQEHLFEAYYHARGNTSYGKGLGLGLALSKMLVELHGGKIWAKARKGKGSKFAFSLPIKGGSV